MDGQRVPRRNVIKYDVIGMLIFILSAIFHDPIHDFGLTIERMAKIVLYIDEMIRQLNGSRAIPQGGGSNFDEMMVGGILTSYRSKGSHREKKTPRQRSKKSHRSQKSQRSRDNHGVKKKHLLSPIMEKTPSPSPSRRTIKFPSYYTDTVVLSLPMTTPIHRYIHRYFVISTSIGNVSRGNNTGLEILVQVNRLIDSLKYCVVQTVMMTADVVETGISKDTILECIRIIIGQVETTVRHDNSEFTDEHFDVVKNKCVFILESMHILLSHMNIPQNDDIPEPNDFDNYKEQQRLFKWLNIFNGPLFDDIMRVIVVGKMTGLPDAPNILELYRLFFIEHRQRGGGDSRKPDNTIMTGGAKMTLSSFRVSDNEKRNELVATLNEWWDTLKVQDPPDQDAYDRFYNTHISPPPTMPRGSDSRLIRLLHLERYSEMKKRVKDIRDGAQLRATPPARITRVVQQLMEDPTTLKDVIDAFMGRVKSDFDSLIAEEELAIEAAQAADAARPIRGDQRAAVYKMSHIIAKKGLEYALHEFRAITVLLQPPFGLDQQTLVLLPNLDRFLQVANTYVIDIMNGQVQDPGALTAGLPVHDYMEKDKYDTLLFQLFLLGLIHRHGTAGGGGGLPDIDSRLAERMVQKLRSPDHTARYMRDGYVYLDNADSHRLFDFISRNHTQYNVMDNGIPSAIKGLLQGSTLCNIPARADPAAGFGGCKENNQDFDSMIMVVTDLEERTEYFTKHIYDRNSNTVEIVFSIRLSDGVFIADTIPDIDLSKAPNVLSANRVMRDAIQEMINIWKSNPARTPAQLWSLLEDNDNFVRLMKDVTKKGHGDIDQEDSALAPNAGFEDAAKARQPKWQKHLLFGAGDRPSIGRGINDMKFVVNRGDLFREGKSIMSYTNETRSFTLAHEDCIRGILNRQPRGRGPATAKKQRIVGGSLKFSRRYTRKKSSARR